MIIPTKIRLLGTSYTVRVIPVDQWDDDEDCVGKFKPTACEILVKQRAQDATEHAFMHELLHAALLAMGRDKLYKDEAFVDTLAGLIHQALTTAE